MSFVMQFSGNLDDLLELLCSDAVILYDYENAETMLKALEEKAEGQATHPAIFTSLFRPLFSSRQAEPLVVVLSETPFTQPSR